MEKEILNAMVQADKPMKSGEISEATGIAKKEVDKIIKKLKTADKIYSPKRCFYDVKK